MSEQQADYDKYLLLLAYVYTLHVYRSIKVPPFRLAFTKALPEPATVVPKRTSLTTDEDMVSPMYASLEPDERSTELRQKAGKKLNLAK